MCRLLLGLFYWFAQYNVFIVNGIIIINQLLILPLRDFFFNPLPEYIQATFSRTGRLQAQESALVRRGGKKKPAVLLFQEGAQG